MFGTYKTGVSLTRLTDHIDQLWVPDLWNLSQCLKLKVQPNFGLCPGNYTTHIKLGFLAFDVVMIEAFGHTKMCAII